MSLFSRFLSRFTSRESSPRADLFAHIRDLSKRFEALAQAHDRRFRALEHQVVWKTDAQFRQQEELYRSLAQELEHWVKRWELQSVDSEALLREWESWKKQRPTRGTKDFDRAQELFVELVARGQMVAPTPLDPQEGVSTSKEASRKRKPASEYIPTVLAADRFTDVDAVYAPRVQAVQRECDRLWKALKSHQGGSEEALHRAHMVKRLTHDIARWRRLERLP